MILCENSERPLSLWGQRLRMWRWFLVPGLAASTLALFAEPETKVSEPRILSMFPFAGQRGATYEAVIRGRSLAGARAFQCVNPYVQARVLRMEQEPSSPADTTGTTPPDLLHIEMTINERASAGVFGFRVVTDRGVSNEMGLHVVNEPVKNESDLPAAICQFPFAVNGRIGERGEADAFWIEVKAGQALTFEAVSGHASMDPAISLYEPSGSWLDPGRLNRIAFNDEPLYYPGFSNDARLATQFTKSGKYCVKVQSFSSQGGPDCVYQLRIAPGLDASPPLRPKMRPGWEERHFTRHFGADWIGQLGRRGGDAKPVNAPEVFHPAPEGAAEVPVMLVGGVVEGRITSPAETHVIRLKVEKPQSLVIEVETPEATMPRFNPVVRLLELGGSEIATNVYTKLNNNNLKMSKALYAKTAFSLYAPGQYKLLIRDITTDRGGTDFAYRVLVRPQVPHLGKVDIVENEINLESGTSKPIMVNFDREEGFGGLVAVVVDGLPQGVTAMAGALNSPEKPPLPNAGKIERYTTKTQTTAVLLVAASDAPLTGLPVLIRIVVRPVVEGCLGEPVTLKEIPLMVVARRLS